jgi:hypothetical protein
MKFFLTQHGDNMDIWKEMELVREGQSFNMRVFHMKRVAGAPLTYTQERAIKVGKWSEWMTGSIVAESDSLEELISVAALMKL